MAGHVDDLRGRMIDFRVGQPLAPLRRKPTYIRCFFVPGRILSETQRALQAAAPREGYLVWTGNLVKGQDAAIETVFVFSGPATIRSAAASPEDLVCLQAHLRKTGEFVFAQVHSHPGRSFHSPSDSIHAFSFKKGFLSIVVPDYGRVDMQDLSRCVVFERDGGWRRWGSHELARRILISG